jgi:hypothetical protein
MGPEIELKTAISIAFNFTQWPYLQNEKAAACLAPVHPLSDVNLLITAASKLLLSLVTLSSVSALII